MFVESRKIRITFFECNPYSEAVNKVQSKINKNYGKMVPCDINTNSIAGVRYTAINRWFSSACRLKFSGFMNQSQFLKGIQILSGGRQADVQKSGNFLVALVPIPQLLI